MRDAVVSSLFVFNTTLKPACENPAEEDYALCKLLYYYPESAPPYEKQSHVGLAEGMCMFVDQFSNEPLESIHTEKHTHILYPCEPNFWICIVLQHSSGEGFLRTQDLQTHPEVLKSIAKTFYRGFYLFHGAFSEFSYPEDYPGLGVLLGDYTTLFLFELSSKEDPFDGFFYCPLDKKSYLSVLYTINNLTSTHPEIEHSLVIYEGHLVYTSLTQIPSSILYSYFSQGKQWKRLATIKRDPVPHACRYARLFDFPEKGFLYGKQEDLVFMPEIYLPEHPPYRLMVWVQDNLLLVLLLNKTVQDSFCEQTSSFLENSGSELAGTIAPQFQRAIMQEDNYKFLYYNRMNLAIKQSSRLATIDEALYKLILSVSAEMQNSSKTDAMVRTLLKTQIGWVMGVKILDSREIFVILPPSSSPANKVEEEIIRFAQHYFHNIFTCF